MKDGEELIISIFNPNIQSYPSLVLKVPKGLEKLEVSKIYSESPN